MVRSAGQQSVRGNGNAASRLRDFLDVHADARWRYGLTEIAREIGVSRQMVFVMLPGWTEERQRLAAKRVRAYARRHRTVRGADPGERRSWASIAAEIGLPVSMVKTIWRTLGLSNSERLDPDCLKRRRGKWQVRHLAEVLRTETCVICGADFAWTRGLEYRRKYDRRSFTCSRSCAQRFRFRKQASADDAPVRRRVGAKA